MAPEICFTFHTSRAATPLPAFIRKIIAEFPLSYNLREEKNRISLQADGPEEELAALADALGRELPLSILLTASEITPAAGPLKPSRERPVPADEPPPPPTAAKLPPCPRCLIQAETNFRAGLSRLTADCELCDRQATEPEPLTGLFPPAQAQSFNNPADYTTLFSQAAQYLAAGHPLDLDSPRNGRLTATVKPQGPIAQVLITDPTAIPLFWQCGDEELLLLAALEKPLVRLEPSRRTLDEYKLSSRPLAVGLADELFYWYLGRHLQEAGVPLLFLSSVPATADPSGARLSWGEPPRPTGAVPSNLGRPLMLVLDRQRWLLSGCRGLPPIPPSPTVAAPGSPARHLQGYRGFLATTPEPTEVKSKLFGISLLPGPQGLALLTGNHRQTAMVLAALAPEKARPIREILKAVASLDEAAQRLCRNYAARFPRRWQTLQQAPQPWRLDDLAKLGALVARLAGGGAEDDSAPAAAPTTAPAVGSYQIFLELAATMVPGRSPRLELAGERENELGDLHHLLRSAMSYALAGADPAAICRGCLESLAERLAAMIWSHCGPDSPPRVALCSELALHPAFLAAIRGQGGPDFLLTPPPWPLDALPALAEAADQGRQEATNPAQLPPDDDRRAALRSLFGLLGCPDKSR